MRARANSESNASPPAYDMVTIAGSLLATAWESIFDITWTFTFPPAGPFCSTGIPYLPASFFMHSPTLSQSGLFGSGLM